MQNWNLGNEANFGFAGFFKTMQENGFHLGVAGISYYLSARSPYINAMTMYKKLILQSAKNAIYLFLLLSLLIRPGLLPARI